MIKQKQLFIWFYLSLFLHLLFLFIKLSGFNLFFFSNFKKRCYSKKPHVDELDDLDLELE